jgi:hypothetical protein
MSLTLELGLNGQITGEQRKKASAFPKLTTKVMGWNTQGF